MHFQLTHEDERRWVLVLMQLEKLRLDLLKAKQ